ncbi:MAG: hypothetical protein MUF06_02380 [Pirellulaceae bacterium]|jgi:hypothetical protein|nr:hypothetical protein [Pirellulaceae bacterium]
MSEVLLRFNAILESADRGSPLAVTFDAALSALEPLARMFIEPDGSFVWRGTTDDGETWQLDGNLIDRGASLAHVELKGTCPSGRLDEVLRALGWPEQAVAFQLPERGEILSEQAFRERAAGGSAIRE